MAQGRAYFLSKTFGNGLEPFKSGGDRFIAIGLVPLPKHGFGREGHLGVVDEMMEVGVDELEGLRIGVELLDGLALGIKLLQGQGVHKAVGGRT